MIRIIGPKEIRRVSKNDLVINTTSSSKTWSRGLSPFLLGPVPLYQQYVSKNVENAWQYSKVYIDHIGRMGLPTEEYWEWAKEGWNNPYGVRYPMGKGAKPEYSYWDGKLLDYIDARKQIYIPLYAQAVKKSDAFSRLEREYYNNDKKITLFDYDAYDHIALSLNYAGVINNKDYKMCHAFILAMLLEKYDKVCFSF